MAADSLEDLEAGIRRINVDVLRKIIEALESDITDVWPSTERPSNLQSTTPPTQQDDPLNLSRLAEIHSLTGAQASCMFTGIGPPDLADTAAEEAPGNVLRAIASINLNDHEREWLRHSLLQETTTGPWDTYLYCQDGRSLYLCLKNARLEFWAEGFIERCLSAWLAPAPV